MSALVVRLSDRTESFLAGRVPNLKLHIFTIYLHMLYFEVDSYSENKHTIRSYSATCKVRILTYGSDVLGRERVFSESQQ